MKEETLQEYDLSALNLKDILNETPVSPCSSETKPNTTLWDSMISHLYEYKENIPYRRRNYLIDEEIINIFQSINIKGSSTTNVINAILRSFIHQEKEELKKYLKPQSILS